MIKLRSNATKGYACFAADCSVRCNQNQSGLNDSIQTGMALDRGHGPGAPDREREKGHDVRRRRSLRQAQANGLCRGVPDKMKYFSANPGSADGS